MSEALFLPRELFACATSAPRAEPAARPPRGVHFASGEAVAADLLKGLTPMSAPAQANPERRRQPRPAHSGGLDLSLA